MQTDVSAFVAYQVVTSCTRLSLPAGERYLFVYGGRSAAEPVLGDWCFLRAEAPSCAAVRARGWGAGAASIAGSARGGGSAG